MNVISFCITRVLIVLSLELEALAIRSISRTREIRIIRVMVILRDKNSAKVAVAHLSDHLPIFTAANATHLPL